MWKLVFIVNVVKYHNPITAIAMHTLFDISHSKKNKNQFWKIGKLWLNENSPKPRSFEQHVIIQEEKQSKLKKSKPYFCKMNVFFIIFEK